MENNLDSNMLNEFINQSNNGVVILNQEGKIIQWNSAQEQLSGISMDVALSSNIWDIQWKMMTDDDKEGISKKDIKTKLFLLLDNTFKNKSMSVKLKHQNGSIRYIDQNIYAFSKDNQKFIGTINHDVTKKKELEQTIKKSESNFRLLSESASELFKCLSLSDIFNYSAKKLHALMGYEGIVSISEFDYTNNVWAVSAIEGLKEKIQNISKLVGFDVNKLKGPMNSEFLKNMVEGELTQLNVGFHELTNGMFPKKLETSIQKLLGFKAFHSISFKQRNTIYGNVTFIMNRKSEELDKVLIESFISLVSIHIEKYITLNELKLREANFQLINKNIIDVIWKTDKELKFTYISPSVTKTYGYSIEELMGKAVLDLFPKEEHEKVIKNVEVELEGRSPLNQSFNYNMIHKNGSLLPVEITSQAVYNEDTDFIGFIGVTRDVSDRVETSRALLESEEKYRELFDNMGSGVAVYEAINDGEDFVFVDFNKAAEIHSNSKKEDLIGKKVTDKFPAIKDIGLFDVFQKVLKTGKPIDHPLKQYKDNRIQEWVENYVYKLPSGHIVAIYEDTSIEHKAIEALKESEKKFKSLFENINEAFALHEIICDENNKPIDFIFLDCNSTYENLTKLKRTEIVGKRGLEVIPDLEQKWIDAYGKVALTGKAIEVIDHSEYLNKYWSVKVYSPKKNQFAVAFTDITKSIVTQKTLEESENRFRTLFEKSADPTLIIEGDKFILCNDATVNFLGYTEKNDIEGKTPWELSPEFQPDGKKSIDKAREMIELAIENGSYRFEWIHSKADGENRVIDVLLTHIPLMNQVYTVWRDITESKNARKELVKLSTAVEQGANTIVITDTVGNIEYVNPQFTKLSGYTFEEAKGQNPRFLNAGTQPQEYYKEMWETISSGKIWKGEFNNKAKNGDLFWENVTISPVKNEKAEITNYLAIKENITDIKEAEKDLKKSEEKFRYLVNEMNEGLMQTDLNDSIIFVNPKICKMLGYKNEELIGKVGYETIIFDEDIELIKKNNLLRSKESSDRYTVRMKRKDGSFIWTQITGSPVYDNEAKVIGTIGLVADISQLKKIEEELDKHRENLEDIITQRLSELKEKNKQLERMNDLFVGREFRIKELKEKIKTLENKIKIKSA